MKVFAESMIIFKTLSVVLRRPGFVLLMLIASIFFLAIPIVLPLYKTIGVIFFSPEYALLDKFIFLLTSFLSFPYRFDHISQAILFLFSILSGLNLTLLVYYLRMQSHNISVSRAGTFGFVFGIFGIGCSSCGNIFLTIFLGTTTTIGFFNFFPLHGLEISLLGIGFLMYSLYLLSFKIFSGQTCRV